MAFLQISTSCLHFELIRTPKVLLSFEYHGAMIGVFPQMQSNLTQLFPGDHMLTSSSWFSNILHPKPIGRKHLMGERGQGNKSWLACFYSYHSLSRKFSLTHPPHLPQGKPRHLFWGFCVKLKRKQKKKIPLPLPSAKLKAPGELPALADHSRDPQPGHL